MHSTRPVLSPPLAYNTVEKIPHSLPPLVTTEVSCSPSGMVLRPGRTTTPAPEDHQSVQVVLQSMAHLTLTLTDLLLVPDTPEYPLCPGLTLNSDVQRQDPRKVLPFSGPFGAHTTGKVGTWSPLADSPSPHQPAPSPKKDPMGDTSGAPLVLLSPRM